MSARPVIQLKSRSERASRANGFTLIEIMLAMAVSAIVLAGIGGVFYSALRLREHTAAAIDEALPLQQAMTVLRRDLKGSLPPGGTVALAGDFRIEALGGGVSENFRLHFYTSSAVISDATPFGDIQEVLYELRDPEDRSRSPFGKELYRSVNRNPLTTSTVVPNDQWLVGNVQSLGFSAYDGSDWRDTWDTSAGDTNLPTAIRVRIALGSADKSAANTQQPFTMVVPLIVQSRTNDATSSTSTTGATQ
jgi:type II secretion system protein J